MGSKLPYHSMSAVLTADSISEIDSRLSTFIISVPPTMADHIRCLPKVVVTPIHWGKTREEIVEQLLERLDTPLAHLGNPTPFGTKLLQTEWRFVSDKIMDYIARLAATCEDVDTELLWSLIQPFVPNHFMVSSTQWDVVFKTVDPNEDIPLYRDMLAQLVQAEPVRMQADDQWHMPWITHPILEEITQDAKEAAGLLGLSLEEAYDRSLFQATLVSFARCARGGPIAEEGKEPGLASELVRASEMLHDNWWRYANVAAHIATPDRVTDRKFEMVHCHGEYFGWNQYKHLYQFAKTSQDVVAKNLSNMKQEGPSLRVIEGGKNDERTIH